MAKFADLTVELQLQSAAFQRGMDAAAKSLDKAQAKAKQTQTSMSGLERGMTSLVNAAKTAAAAFATFKGVEGIAKAGDQIQSLTGSFTALLGSSNKASDMMERVFAIVSRTGAPLEAVAAGAQRMSIALGDLGATNQQIADISENFLKLARIGGSSAEEAAAAFQQLGQSLGAGKLSGDELRSVLEGAPLVAKEIAKEFGVTTGKLKELGEAGTLTSARVANALLKATGRIDAAFAALPQTFEQGMNRASASLTKFLAEFDTASRTSTNLQLSLSYIAGIFDRWAQELAKSNKEFSLVKLAADAVRITFETIAVLVANTAFVAETLARSLGAAAEEAYNLMIGAPSKIGEAWKASEAEAAKARAGLDEFEHKILRTANTVAQANRDRRGDELGGRGDSGTLKDKPGAGGSKGDADKAAAAAKALRQQGEALAAAVDPLNAYNQKVAEYQKLLDAAAISSVTWAKAMEIAKEQLTASGDALTASVDPAFAYELRLREINKAYRDGAIEVETWVKLQEKAKEEMQEAEKRNKKKSWLGQLTEDVVEAGAKGVGTFFEDIISGSMTASEAFSKMVQSIISDIARLLAELLAKQAAKFIIKSIFGGVSASSSSVSANASAAGPALGMSFNAARALGLEPATTANAETGADGIAAGGFGANGTNGRWQVVINQNAPGVDVRTAERADGGLEVTIEKVRSALTSDVVRGGNQFSRALEGTFALGRGRVITAELKRVYASAPSDRRYLETLELAHPLFPATFFLVNDAVPWTLRLTTGGALQLFKPTRFTAVAPTRDGKGQQDMTLAIDNVGREAMDAIEAAAADPSINIVVTYRVYLDVPNSDPQNDPPLVLSLESIAVTHEAISGTATRADILNKPYPSALYRVDLFPGLQPMTTLDWVNGYVGLPYVAGAFDCWSLVRAVYRDQLGVELPDWRWAEPFALSAKLAAFDAALLDVERVGLASELDAAEPFAIALILRGARPHHVGVATGAGVLHAERWCGARHDPMARFRQTYPSVRWWRWPR